MIVDNILLLLGGNPAGYYEPLDKWVAIYVIIIEKGPYFMPLLLGGIPVLWLFIRKWRRKSISKTMIIIATALTIGLGILGIFILDFLSDLAFGLSYQRMYGGQF